MLEASVWTILKELTEGIPKQGSVLTYFFDFLDNKSMSWSPRRWIGSKSIKEGFALLHEILIETRDVVERS